MRNQGFFILAAQWDWLWNGNNTGAEVSFESNYIKKNLWVWEAGMSIVVKIPQVVLLCSQIRKALV